ARPGVLHSFPTRRSSDLIVGQFAIARGGAVEERADVGIAIRRAEPRCALDVARARVAGPIEQLVPDEERDAERAAGIPGRRLDPDRKSTRLNSSHDQISY